MRLQLIPIALSAIACAPPNAGITFDEPDSGPATGGTTDTSGLAEGPSSDPGGTTPPGDADDEVGSGVESSSGAQPYTTSEDGAGSSDGTTGVALPDPVTIVEWQFGTTTYAGQFAPRNIVAVWIENDAGGFVRTLMMLSEIEKIHLVEWNLVTGGNVVDAVTGASPQDHTMLHTGAWDLRDAAGVVVPDGDYVFRAEMTESNSAGPPPEGPLRTVPFTLGNGHFDLLPEDGDIFHSVRVYGHD
jgi:hypothetical protein